MKNKKIVIIIILILAVIIAFLVYKMSGSGVPDNPSGSVGNTNGNLYNGGLVCEYGDYVYIVNPYDDNALYRMKSDGSDYEKVCDDNTSYLNIFNGQIYYKKFNGAGNKDELFSRIMYGIVRMEVGKNGSDIIHNGKIDCMTLCGNYIYYRYYDDEQLFSFRKLKIDGTEDELISQKDYAPIAVYNNEIYMINPEDNHYIVAFNTDTETFRTVLEGNCYMPDIYNGYLYYIDLDNNRALTKVNLSNMSSQVLSTDKVINYNLSGQYGVIYYQAENSVSDHRLRRMSLDGTNQIDIMQGDFCKINITKQFTYFYFELGDSLTVYRTPTNGEPYPRVYAPEVIKD